VKWKHEVVVYFFIGGTQCRVTAFPCCFIRDP